MSTVTVSDHLEQAKECIARGETSMREAVEHIDKAMRLDSKLTQRDVAARVGMSAAWVNRLIRWKAEGYKSETPFGPQSQASRKKAAAVQATEQPPEKVTPEGLLRKKARAEHDTAKASAAEARAKAAEAKHKAERRRGYQYEQRERLVKLLGKLGSEHEGERATAAKKADDLRTSLGLSWSNLIVPCRVQNVEHRTDAA
jgi:hypothetical protein